jgi:hypothetical protein
MTCPACLPKTLRNRHAANNILRGVKRREIAARLLSLSKRCYRYHNYRASEATQMHLNIKTIGSELKDLRNSAGRRRAIVAAVGVNILVRGGCVRLALGRSGGIVMKTYKKAGSYTFYCSFPFNPSLDCSIFIKKFSLSNLHVKD